MATLPEEFPVVLTIFLALGAWRISRSRVLTRRMPAIETLGAATVLCVDKTGHADAEPDDGAARSRRPAAPLDLGDARRARCPEAFHGLLEYAILASQRDPFDPMEKALHEARQRWLAAPSTCTATGRWCASTR